MDDTIDHYSQCLRQLRETSVNSFTSRHNQRRFVHIPTETIEQRQRQQQQQQQQEQQPQQRLQGQDPVKKGSVEKKKKKRKRDYLDQ
jgi:ribosomal protein L34E